VVDEPLTEEEPCKLEEAPMVSVIDLSDSQDFVCALGGRVGLSEISKAMHLSILFFFLTVMLTSSLSSSPPGKALPSSFSDEVISVGKTVVRQKR